MKRIYVALFSCLLVGGALWCMLYLGSAVAVAEEAAAPLWQGSDALKAPTTAAPANYRTLTLNPTALDNILKNEASIRLPLPDGSYNDFFLTDSPIFESAFSKAHLGFRSYQLVSVDDSFVRGRMVRLPSGLHALIEHLDRFIMIDPNSHAADNKLHLSYYLDELPMPLSFDENVFGTHKHDKPQTKAVQPIDVTELRSYRIAIATDGDYAQQQGGTVTSTLSAVVSRLSDINLIYESQLGIRLLLVANNADVIFTDPSSDPYPDTPSRTLLMETNRTVLTNEIGNNNYDVGHLFSGALNGGVAYIGAACDSTKGGGMSGLNDLRVMLHELAHQFDADHSLNGDASVCAGARITGAAYEPGSGTTVMGYSGVCAPQNIGDPDNYFGLSSVLAIQNYITNDDGATCGTAVVTGNQVPVIDIVSAEITIPAHTPFSLSGSASDPDAHPIQYNWQQYDLGPAGHPNQPAGNAPLFRVLPPSSIATRTFPTLDDILDNYQRIGEILPSYSRDMRFRLVVRDNQVPQGFASGDVTVHVAGDAGPLRVLQPDRNTLTWPIGSTQAVVWDVANTDIAPINCTDVNIELSTDGGQHFNLPLATAVANSGSYSITVPNTATASARLRIACATYPDHFFFAIADAEFSITATREDARSGAQAVSSCGTGYSAAPTLLTPLADAFWESTQPVFSWLAPAAEDIIHLQVSRDPTFAEDVHNFRPISTPAYRLPAKRALTSDTSYYWRVRVDETCGGGEWSARQSFRTWRPELAADTVDGLVLWLDGNDVAGDFSADTDHYDLLPTWQDKSTTRSDATSADPAFAGQQPNGGLGQVELINQRYLLTDSVPTVSSIISTSLFAVLEPEPQADGPLLALTTSSAPTDTAYLGMFAAGSQVGVGATISASSLFSSATPLTAPLLRSDEWLLATYSADTLVDANGHRSRLSLFGQLVAGDSERVSLADSAGDRLEVGGISADVGDILLFDRQLDATEQQQIEGYLAHKWHLAERLPSTHLFSATPPNFSINQPPVVASATLTVNEFLPFGTIVGTVSASDADTPLTFAIVHGNNDNAFRMNTNGEIWVANLSALDFNQNQRFDLTIDVTDAHSNARTGSAIVIINVIETNTAPIVTVSPIVVDGFALVGAPTGWVEAFDYNTEDTLSFNIIGGNDDMALSLNVATGQLNVFDNSSFAEPAVQTRTLTVTVADDGEPQQVVTVTVPVTITRCIAPNMVSVSADSGSCSLRQAIHDAPANSFIRFHPTLADTTIHLSSPILIEKAITINGDDQISLSGDSDMDGSGDNRILIIESSDDVTLRQITLLNGYADTGSGAAINKIGSGTLTLLNCTVWGNFSGTSGGALSIDGGAVTIDACTFSGNSADSSGGAIYQCSSALTIRHSMFISNTSAGSGGAVQQACSAPLEITNSSFYGNVSAEWGGALNINHSATITNSTIYSNTAISGTVSGGALAIAPSGTLVLRNTIVADSPSGGDCAIAAGGTLSVNSHNLIEDGTCSINAVNMLTGTAGLLPPADNGGATWTLATTSSSAARDSGDSTHCPATDQRLFKRSDGFCDIGAYESTATTTAVNVSQQTPTRQLHQSVSIIVVTLLSSVLYLGSAKLFAHRNQPN